MRFFSKNLFLFALFSVSQCFSGMIFADDLDSTYGAKKIHPRHKNNYVSSNNHRYLPYLEVGGTRFSSGESRNGFSTDFFIPLWQSTNDLIFSDLRLYDRTGTPFEGNAHLGYRHLSPDKEYIIGVYGAFDRKRSAFGNYFNQVTVGGEYWLKSLFLGANFYQPIGGSSKLVSINQGADFDKTYKNIWIDTNRRYENVMRGCDAEIGYEFTRGLAWYVGGYYFNAKDTDTIYGPRARITYDWSLENGKRIAAIFDKLGLEFGVQRDKPRGTIWYANAKVRIGLLPNKGGSLEGVARHMVDLVHRDVDLVTSQTYSQTREAYKEAGKTVYFEAASSGRAAATEDRGSSRIKRVIGKNHEIVTDLGERLIVDVGPVFEAKTNFSSKGEQFEGAREKSTMPDIEKTNEKHADNPEMPVDTHSYQQPVNNEKTSAETQSFNIENGNGSELGEMEKRNRRREVKGDIRVLSKSNVTEAGNTTVS